MGQPSVTGVDPENGTLLLFYTRGTAETKTFAQHLNLGEMNNPKKIGKEFEITTKGLTGQDGKRDFVLNNADFAYDLSRDMFFIVRPRNPFDRTPYKIPVTDELQIATISGSGLWSGNGEWQVLGHIKESHPVDDGNPYNDNENNFNPVYTGRQRNHNAGILKNVYGGLLEVNKIRINFAVGDDIKHPLDWLWTYRMYGVIGSLVD